ncbi:MAG: polyprenyl synthetase family protein [Chlamydiales bacterium]
MNILADYQEQIDGNLYKSINSFGPKTILRDAIEYAFKNGGKRLRPAIVHMISEMIDCKIDVTDSALAVEYFHTASLIADDLPCMDNDDQRRELPSLHKVYGESTAILATYSLISAGYDRIRLNGEKLNNPSLISIAIENVAFNTGILGATGGQYADLFPSQWTEAVILDVIDKKTGTLFEIAFVLGWIFGGGDLSLLKWVKQAACHFGRAFQISDDFVDLFEDKENKKIPSLIGFEKAAYLLTDELSHFQEVLQKLTFNTSKLLSLSALIENQLATTPAASFFRFKSSPTFAES